MCVCVCVCVLAACIFYLMYEYDIEENEPSFLQFTMNQSHIFQDIRVGLSCFNPLVHTHILSDVHRKDDLL